MPLEVYKACAEGYSDRVFDQQILSVITGFWAGHYQRAKRPTPPKSVIAKMIRSRETSSEHSEEVDVDKFLATEAAFQEMLRQAEEAAQKEEVIEDG